MSPDLSTLPTFVWVIIAILAAAQLALMLTALIWLARTPRERVNFDRKWIWVLIILFFNTVGPILFIAIGRRPAPVEVPAHVTEAPSAARLVQRLYGDEQA